MLNVRLAGETVVNLAVTGDFINGVFLCCPLSPRDVLDENWDRIESVSEGFPTYYFKTAVRNSFSSYGHLSKYWSNSVNLDQTAFEH